MKRGSGDSTADTDNPRGTRTSSQDSGTRAKPTSKAEPYSHQKHPELLDSYTYQEYQGNKQDEIYAYSGPSSGSVPDFVIDSDPVEEHSQDQAPSDYFPSDEVKSTPNTSMASSRASSTTNLNMYSPILGVGGLGTSNANNLFMRKRPSPGHEKGGMSHERGPSFHGSSLHDRKPSVHEAGSVVPTFGLTHERRPSSALSVHERRSSLDIPIHITSPKTPIRGTSGGTAMPSFQSQQRNPLASPIKYGSNVEPGTASGIGSLPSESTGSSATLSGKAFIVQTNEVDRKRLVDQFYNSINEPSISSASSVADMQQHLAKASASNANSITSTSVHNTSIGSVESTRGGTATQTEKTRVELNGHDDNEDDNSYTCGREMTDEEFAAIVEGGGFRFNVSTRATEDEELTSYLLNIDGVTEEMVKNGGHFRNKMFLGGSATASSVAAAANANFSGRVDGVGSIQMLSQIIESLGNTLQYRDEQKVKQLPRQLQRAEHIQQLATSVQDTGSLLELESLSKYLDSMLASTNSLRDELVKNRETIRVKYRSEISDNVARLNEVLGDLNVVESRLNQVKKRINEDKGIMSLEMIEKLELLEFIETRFQEHSKRLKDTRFKQLNIILGIVVVLVSLYFGFR